jgi:hypothetical protein
VAHVHKEKHEQGAEEGKGLHHGPHHLQAPGTVPAQELEVALQQDPQTGLLVRHQPTEEDEPQHSGGGSSGGLVANDKEPGVGEGGCVRIPVRREGWGGGGTKNGQRANQTQPAAPHLGQVVAAKRRRELWSANPTPQTNDCNSKRSECGATRQGGGGKWVGWYVPT